MSGELGRRSLFGLAAAGAGAVALSGCGWLGLDQTSCAVPRPDDPAPAPPSGTADLGPLEAVPVGQAVAVGEGCNEVILARPADDEVRVFQAICPHKGVVVGRQGDDWVCPAHGARFAGLTGALLQGPATAPLAPLAVAVGDGRVVVTGRPS